MPNARARRRNHVRETLHPTGGYRNSANHRRAQHMNPPTAIRLNVVTLNVNVYQAPLARSMAHPFFESPHRRASHNSMHSTTLAGRNSGSSTLQSAHSTHDRSEETALHPMPAIIAMISRLYEAAAPALTKQISLGQQKTNDVRKSTKALRDFHAAVPPGDRHRARPSCAENLSFCNAKRVSQYATRDPRLQDTNQQTPSLNA